jgi:hypothetical protein
MIPYVKFFDKDRPVILAFYVDARDKQGTWPGL